MHTNQFGTWRFHDLCLRHCAQATLYVMDNSSIPQRRIEAVHGLCRAWLAGHAPLCSRTLCPGTGHAVPASKRFQNGNGSDTAQDARSAAGQRGSGQALHGSLAEGTMVRRVGEVHHAGAEVRVVELVFVAVGRHATQVLSPARRFIGCGRRRHAAAGKGSLLKALRMSRSQLCAG